MGGKKHHHKSDSEGSESGSDDSISNDTDGSSSSESDIPDEAAPTPGKREKKKKASKKSESESSSSSSSSSSSESEVEEKKEKEKEESSESEAESESDADTDGEGEDCDSKEDSKCARVMVALSNTLATANAGAGVTLGQFMSEKEYPRDHRYQLTKVSLVDELSGLELAYVPDVQCDGGSSHGRISTGTGGLAAHVILPGERSFKRKPIVLVKRKAVAFRAHSHEDATLLGEGTGRVFASEERTIKEKRSKRSKSKSRSRSTSRVPQTVTVEVVRMQPDDPILPVLRRKGVKLSEKQVKKGGVKRIKYVEADKADYERVREAARERSSRQTVPSLFDTKISLRRAFNEDTPAVDAEHLNLPLTAYLTLDVHYVCVAPAKSKAASDKDGSSSSEEDDDASD
jgi:hypothetical protein